MARLSYNFGELRPDDAPHASQGLVSARGVYASLNGYRPIKAFSETIDALPSTFLGGGSFLSVDGNARVIAGTATNLYGEDSGTWSSKLGSLTVNTRWRFTQFGDDVVCVNGGEPVKYRLTANTATVLGGTPPTADLCATVRDFVVLGRTDGRNNYVTWSGQGSCESWTASVNQSGEQPLYDGGKVMGLTSGEVCYIVQRFAVRRMSYRGDAADPWQFDVVSMNDGCVAEGSLLQVGALFFFRSDRGFVMFDGAQFRPIGTERIDRTFKAAYAVSDLDNLWAVADPDRHLAIWVIYGRLWIYNWVMDRWTVADIPVTGAFQTFSIGTSLDALDAIYGDLESIPYSLDDARFAGGTPQLTFVHNDQTFGVLSGDNIAARIEMPFIEFAQGRTARVNRVRPITDATSGLTLTADQRQRLGDAESISTYTQLNSRGDMPVRIAARSAKLKLDIAAAAEWSYLQGLEITVMQGGRA